MEPIKEDYTHFSPPAVIPGQGVYDNPSLGSDIRNIFQMGTNKAKKFTSEHEGAIRGGLSAATSAVTGAIGSPQAKAAGVSIKSGLRNTAKDLGSVAKTMVISAGLGAAGSAIADRVRKNKRKKRQRELQEQRRRTRDEDQ